MSAGAVLAEARTAGFVLAVERGGLRCRPTPPPDLLDRLRTAKPELIAILRGDRCKACGRVLDWPRPVGVIHGDGSASCLPCYESASASPVREVPTVTANCARCRRVRPLDADRVCMSCATMESTP